MDMVMKLKHDCILLKQEVRALRSKVGSRRRGSMTVRYAHDDALYMIQSHYLGYGTGRVAMAKVGMSKRRWQWSVAYLRAARVVSKYADNQGLKWMVSEVVAIERVKDIAGIQKAELEKWKREV